jgi:hypothetical protein
VDADAVAAGLVAGAAGQLGHDRWRSASDSTRLMLMLGLVRLGREPDQAGSGTNRSPRWADGLTHVSASADGPVSDAQ